MNLTCETCGNEFTYDQERGYSRKPALCGPYCHGIKVGKGLAEHENASLRDEVARLGEAFKTVDTFLDDEDLALAGEVVSRALEGRE